MVSKIAVVALVAIVATPILLGFGLNFNTGTDTVYESVGDVINVTPLLQNSTEYTYVSADLLALNSDNFYIDYRNFSPNRWAVGDPFIPLYQSYSKSYSGLYYYSQKYINTLPSTISLATISEMWFTVDYEHYPIYPAGSVDMVLTYNDNTTTTIYRVLAFHYSKDDNKLYYVYDEIPRIRASALANIKSISFTSGADYSGTIYTEWRNTSDTAQSISTDSKYVDISGGFRLPSVLHVSAYGSEITPSILRPILVTPTAAQKVLMTIDLDSITASEYTWYIEPASEKITTDFPMAGERIVLSKTTVGGDVSWTFSRYAAAAYGTNPPSYSEELLYDPSGSNVYQLELTADKATMYYVGAWPQLLGYANSYRSWETDTAVGGDIVKIGFTAADSTDYVESPIMRVDYANVRATETKYITDFAYTPTNIKSVNPETTIDNIARYGTSIDFGGVNFPVSNGNITLGTHNVPVNGITLASTQNPDMTYDNTINGVKISTTATPSTITFNGVWSFNATTQSMQSAIIEINEWQPGKFAWNGLDDNFIMAGLITCIGVFVALGLYGRRSGAKVLPLMLICGGAAFMFFLMI